MAIIYNGMPLLLLLLWFILLAAMYLRSQ